MLTKLFSKSWFCVQPKTLTFAALFAFSMVSAEPGPPPHVGKHDEDAAQSNFYGGNSRDKASAVVQDFYEKLGRGDVTGLIENFAKDAKWVLYGPAGIPFAGVHEGRSGIRLFIETFGQNAKVTRFETKEFLSDKRKVVVQGYEEAVATPTGKTWKAHWTHSFTVERGKILLVEEVLDTAPVLAAFQP